MPARPKRLPRSRHAITRHSQLDSSARLTMHCDAHTRRGSRPHVQTAHIRQPDLSPDTLAASAAVHMHILQHAVAPPSRGGREHASSAVWKSAQQPREAGSDQIDTRAAQTANENVRRARVRAQLHGWINRGVCTGLARRKWCSAKHTCRVRVSWWRRARCKLRGIRSRRRHSPPPRQRRSNPTPAEQRNTVSARCGW
jgi:hypothetical protein